MNVRIATLMVLAGCSSISVEYTTLNPPPHPVSPVAIEHVELFTAEAPARKYVEVGTMTAMHDSITSDEDMFQKMREEAAKRGCDGLVITQRGTIDAIGACVIYAER